MNGVRMSYLVASVGGVGFFGLSMLLLGVWPGRVLEDETRRLSPAHPLPLSDSEQRGRQIYSREGCAYCHTQQIRFVPVDVKRFGAPTQAWETRFDFPHLWGTRRIGPDLSREGQVRSEDWHFAHLYAPRSIVRDSVMPAYPSLFDGGADRPRQAARDLVTYLQSLGRARELAGPEAEARLHDAAAPIHDMPMHDKPMVNATELNAHPARARHEGPTPVLASTPVTAQGKDLYARNCGGCHGERGAGDGPGASTLRPRPANLAAHHYAWDHLSSTLEHGVPGTAMSAWRDLPLVDRAAIAAVVQSWEDKLPQPNVPQGTLELGRKVYAANCAQCHGPNGAGDGSAARKIRIRPASLRAARPSVAIAVRALREGVEGTPMAPWTGRLSEAELMAVVYAIRDFQPSEPKP